MRGWARRANITRVSPLAAKSFLLLLPEVSSLGPARGEQPKIRRYRLVRMRVNPPAAVDRLGRGQASSTPFLGGEF